MDPSSNGSAWLMSTLLAVAALCSMFGLERAEMIQNHVGLKKTVWVTRGLALLPFSSMSTVKEDPNSPFISTKES